MLHRYLTLINPLIHLDGFSLPQCEITKMETQHAKAQAYFKRKTEEASLANKRLKEALERQSAVRQMNATRQNERELSNVGPRVKSLVNDELDIQVKFTLALHPVLLSSGKYITSLLA